MEFQPISHTTISDEIIKQIQSLIMSGQVAPGEFLPSERELSDRFHVGRSSVREALKALTAMGLLKRTREGTVVNDNLNDWLSDQLTLGLLLKRDDIEQIFETRRLIEVGLASLAAQRATKPQIDEIYSWIRDDIGSVDEFMECDIAFHRAIADAAGNEIVRQVYLTIQNVLFKTHHYYTTLDHADHRVALEVIRDIQDQHRRIADAIKAGESEEARRAADAHFTALERSMLPLADAEAGRRHKEAAE